MQGITTLIPVLDKLIQLLVGRVQSIKTELMGPLPDGPIFFAAEAPTDERQVLGQVTRPVMTQEVDVSIEG